jgi:hypothetical protein
MHSEEKGLISKAFDMARRADRRSGPDVVIIVNPTDVQALHWQERLSDGQYRGKGDIISSSSIVLSVSEESWNGGAGNALGTLNGFLLAAEKSAQNGIIAPQNGIQDHTGACFYAFLRYCGQKSVFMYHTAGKGTRLAPLSLSEFNCKAGVKLPGITGDNAGSRPLSLLEAVIRQTSPLAGTREGRLSVFWGDQIIINENPPLFDTEHDVEIFCQEAAPGEDLSHYGVLIPLSGRSCLQREKLSREELNKLLSGGSGSILKSLGSFSASLEFLEALTELEWGVLTGEKEGARSLNTDPDWWQPLTSDLPEYMNCMAVKGVSPEFSKAQWEKMHSFLKDRQKKGKKVDKLIGYKDLGKGSLWWDYGQNRLYYRNLMLLNGDSNVSRTARVFFGAGEEDSKEKGFSREVELVGSTVLGSSIERGRIVNSVIIDCRLSDAVVKDSVLIGCSALKMRSEGALCYNAVHESISLRSGQILADVFIPDEGRVSLRSHLMRDSRKDYNGGPDGKGLWIYDNIYLYSEMAEKISGVRISDAESAKRRYVDLLFRENGSSKPQADILSSDPGKRASLLARRRDISVSLARMEIVRRMLMFGDLDSVDAGKYSLMFGIETEDAEKEIEIIAATCPGTPPGRRVF